MSKFIDNIIKFFRCCHILKHPILRNIKTIALYSDLNAVRLLIAVAYFIWAFSLIRDPEAYMSEPAYSTISHVVSIEALVTLFFLGGILQTYILLTGCIDCFIAVIYSGANAFFWWFISIALYLGHIDVPADIACSFAVTVGASWVFMRTGNPLTERRNSDHGYRPIQDR